MKKRFLVLSILTIITTVNSLAQPTLTQHTKHTPGDKGVMYICKSEGFIVGPSGANITWDFSNLEYTEGPYYYTKYDKSALPDGHLFPNADYSNGADYYDLSSTSAQLIGRVDASVIVTRYTNPMKTAQWPFTYNDSYTDNFRYEMTGQATNISNGSLSKTADAYGTLVLPDTTYYNALRIYTTFNRKDSIGGPYVHDITGEAMIWYVEGIKSPILSWSYRKEMDGSTVISEGTRVTYYQSFTPAGVSSVVTDKISITAAIKDQQLYLNGDFRNGQTYQLFVYNSIGQQVLKEIFTAQSKRYVTQFPNVSTGLYVIKVQGKGGEAASLSVFKK